MRSVAEILFRLRQELANAVLCTFPPTTDVADATCPLAGLPDPGSVGRALQGTPWASEVLGLAEKIISGRAPLLGTWVDTGPEPAWRRDYLSGKESPSVYFRRLPYLDATKVGDHKNIWELSRHQHLVLLAQAFTLTGDARFSRYVFRQLLHWWEENPFQRGINWASSLEVGLRALSWVWIFHLLGREMELAFRKQFLTELYRHGLHLEYNLSVYFSPNTHLLGEALALHAVGRLFPEFRRSTHWKQMARQILVKELDKQVHPDGGYFEQSTFYHVYALDMFLFHHLLEPLPSTERLEAMAEFLAAMVAEDGSLPFFGDDDGGRLFCPFGRRKDFGRATLATCSVVLGRDYFPYSDHDLAQQAVWWTGPGPSANPAGKPWPSRSFPQSGLVSMRSGSTLVVFDAGPFGPWSGGHSHSDTLSFVVYSGGEEILIDPGTYTYVGDPAWREYFRGSSAHNTVRIDGRDQAEPAGPFRWLHKPVTELVSWKSDSNFDEAEGTCSYNGVRHRRRIIFDKVNALLTITDFIEDKQGACLVEQFWHPGEDLRNLGPGRWSIGSHAELTIDPRAEFEVIEGWRSDAPASRHPAQILRVWVRETLPVELGTVLRLAPKDGTPAN